MNRRDALARMGGLMAMGIFGSSKALADVAKESTAAPAAASLEGKPFSIAHITDVHLIDSRNAERWFSKCLRDIHSDPRKPQLILNTGDSIMDSARTQRDLADRQWKLWQQTLKRECSLPIYHGLGNHDYWAMNLKADDPARKDPMFGRKLALQALGMDKPYYSFDHAGWHFVMLESIHLKENTGWESLIGEEQFKWLENDLAAAKGKPVLIGSHVPILQVIWMRGTKPDKNYAYTADNFHMVKEANRLIDLFAKHKNVKLCFSGHIHQLDRVELNGTTYICDGAVSGDKWKGYVREVQPGYSITTLRPDGTFDYEYKGFGWKA